MNRRGPDRVLLTGASGFIGSHVRRALTDRGASVRALAHRADVEDDGEVVRGDLADPASLRGICADVTVLVHAASLINGDADECRAVNEQGTAALMAEAERARVHHIVYVSTAAVYGNGVHRGPTEEELVPDPVSPASRTRLAAERSVLTVGGTVLRPMFVYGLGDRWFLPILADLVRRLVARPAAGRARLSLISADALAAAVSALGFLPTAELRGTVLHAAHPVPTAVAEIVDVLSEQRLLPRVTGDMDYEEALARLGSQAARQLSLICFDHFYDSSRLWRATDIAPGEGFRETFPRFAQQYREEAGDL